MEELLVYACLLTERFSEEFAIKNAYENKLNELFIINPDDRDFLELELLSDNINESIIYIKTSIDYANFNYHKFGKTLMDLLKPIYQQMDINRFSTCMYSLWEGLAGNLQNKQPFSYLGCADDSNLLNNEEYAKNIYEKMLSFYD